MDIRDGHPMSGQGLDPGTDARAAFLTLLAEVQRLNANLERLTRALEMSLGAHVGIEAGHALRDLFRGGADDEEDRPRRRRGRR